MDKHSGSLIATWVEFLVLEALVGKTLLIPWWVDLLVLEASVVLKMATRNAKNRSVKNSTARNRSLGTSAGLGNME